MPTILQVRRGTTTEHQTFTGLEGEITINTTKDTLIVHDGTTPGGFELALADGSNLSPTSHISIADLKVLVAAASTYQEFQQAIAAL